MLIKVLIPTITTITIRRKNIICFFFHYLYLHRILHRIRVAIMERGEYVTNITAYSMIQLVEIRVLYGI